MKANPQRPKARDGVLSALNVTIEALNIAKWICSITPAQAAFGSVGALLTVIREGMINEQDCVDLGLSCADVCDALDRGLDGRRSDELSQSVLEAIQQLTTTVAEIERKITEQGERNAVSRLFRASDDKEKIASWRLNLSKILYIFNTELAINTHMMVANIHRKVPTGQGTDNPVWPSIDPGEVPPPAPRACFGREELVGRIVGFVENLTPIALVGAGGIGKTTIALTVLHHDRIKERFGDNRRFIRCDRFTPSCSNFLRRLSQAIGADIENPENLTPLWPSLTSKEMLIVLDSAESMLDPQVTSGQEINAVVEELSRFGNVSLCITSRITAAPPDCEILEIPTLSMEAAREAFYQIYKYGRRSDSVDNILEQLEFHPLSVTLLASVAHQNEWDDDRLASEWELHKTGVLQMGCDKSLAGAIEPSPAPSIFGELGSSVRAVLELRKTRILSRWTFDCPKPPLTSLPPLLFLLFPVVAVISMFLSNVISWALPDMAQCLPGFDWSNNSLGQDPCTIGSMLDASCRGVPKYIYPPLNASQTYSPPNVNHTGDTMCRCNTVMYNLVMACVSCQGGQTYSWKVWTSECANVHVAQYPFDIAQGTAVPRWAYYNVAPWHTFLPKLCARRDPEQLPKQPSGTNVGAIVDGVAGPVVPLTIVAVVFLLYVRNRRQRSQQPQTQYVPKPDGGPCKPPLISY